LRERFSEKVCRTVKNGVADELCIEDQRISHKISNRSLVHSHRRDPVECRIHGRETARGILLRDRSNLLGSQRRHPRVDVTLESVLASIVRVGISEDEPFVCVVDCNDVFLQCARPRATGRSAMCGGTHAKPPTQFSLPRSNVRVGLSQMRFPSSTGAKIKVK
jgi:hypothetical protein